MSDDKTPDWMTDEWPDLNAKMAPGPEFRAMAREILRLRADNATLTADLAERTRERDASRQCNLVQVEAARESRQELVKIIERAEAERDAARAELACKGCGGTVGHHLAPDQGGCPGRFVIDGVPMVPAAHVDAARAEVERLTKRVQSMDSSMEHHVATQTARLTSERDAANEERDRWIAAHGIAIRDRNEFAAAQVVKFINDWNASDDDDLPLVAFAARRAAELRKAAPAQCRECDGTGTVEKCDPPGEHANRYQEPCPEGCKAAPAAAPAEFATTNTPGAFAFLAKEPDAYATPPADLHQPMPQGRLEEMRRAYAAGAEKGSMTEPTKSRCRDAVRAIDELLSLRARLAAAEKAKADADATIEGLRNRLAVAEELAATYAARGDMADRRQQPSGWKGLLADIASAINRHSAESDGGNTPDHLLAEMLGSVLVAFGSAVRAREAWYGRDPMAAAAGQRCEPRHAAGLCVIAAERAGGTS